MVMEKVRNQKYACLILAVIIMISGICLERVPADALFSCVQDSSIISTDSVCKEIPAYRTETFNQREVLNAIRVTGRDARRSQVYSATYRCKDGKLEKLTPDRAIALCELGEELKSFEGEKIYLLGDGYIGAKAALESYGLTIENTPDLLISENAYSVARVAKRSYDVGKTTTDIEIAPMYLRMPQAERERLERLKNNEN